MPLLAMIFIVPLHLYLFQSLDKCMRRVNDQIIEMRIIAMMTSEISIDALKYITI